jgi:4,5-dihydroxyphthalate decarboxylase
VGPDDTTTIGQGTGGRPPLRVLLGDYATTHAVRRGTLTSPGLPMTFADVAVPNTAFKRAVRDVEFDVAELALMTFLMARSRGVPLRLLPVVVFSRNPLPHLIGDLIRGRLSPYDLAGRRIGVRSFTTTTAVWVRTLLADLFGVDLSRIEWITLEEGHVAGVADPPNVHRDTSGSDVMGLLRRGVVDAVIADRVPADESFAPIVFEADAAFQSWRDRTGAFTLNHVVTVRESLAHDAGVMRELMKLFRDSRDAAGPAIDPATVPFGLEANRRSLEVAIAAANRDRLLARPLSVSDLITDAIASVA